MSSIIQGLPFIVIILGLLFFIIIRIVARFKKQALGDHGSTNFRHIKFDFKEEKAQPERVKLKCPAFIDKSEGVMKVGIKELTLNGAFVTCPNPFPVGTSFPIRILLDDRDPPMFNAEVVWNNQNVADENIVSRGMKVRFLQLSATDRNTLNQILSGEASPDSPERQGYGASPQRR